jgi:D-alanyl-D-alanine carboxypeptidase
MTALVILENPKYFDFSSVVTVSKEAASQAKTSNYGNLQEGEQYTFEKLIELMLIYSSNHAAFALSETIGVDNFVSMMNKKALDLGMENTRFFNPTGLDSDNLNYSTANDLIILSKYLLKNQPEIFDLTAKPHESFFVENGISLLSLQEGRILVGGKTGYTIAAGGCMDYVFKDRNGNFFINVILGTNDAETRINEMQKIINWI